MLQLAVVISVTSAVALLLGFTEFAAAAAMVSVVMFCLVAITFVATMLAVVGCTLAGRAAYWFPPPG